MRIKELHEQTFVECMVYQARTGALHLEWGNQFIVLDEEQANKIAYDVKDFDQDAYNKFYFPDKY